MSRTIWAVSAPLLVLLAACGDTESIVISQRGRTYEVGEVKWREARRVAENLAQKVAEGGFDVTAIRDELVAKHGASGRASQFQLTGGVDPKAVLWDDRERVDNFVPARLGAPVDDVPSGTIRMSARLLRKNEMRRWTLQLQVRSKRARGGRIEPFDTEFGDRAFAALVAELEKGLRAQGITFHAVRK